MQQFGAVSVPGQFHVLNVLKSKKHQSVNKFTCDFIYSAESIISLSKLSAFLFPEPFTQIAPSLSIIELYSKPRKRPKSSHKRTFFNFFFYTDSTN